MNRIRDYLGELNESIITLPQLRERLVNPSLFFILVLGLPGLVSSLLRVAENNWQPVMTAQIVLYLVALATAIFRERLSFYVRTAVLLGSFLILAIVGLLSYGLAGVAVLTLGIFCVLTAVLLGTRSTMIALLVSLVIMVVAGIGAISGTTAYAFDANVYIASPAAWVFAFLGLTVLAGFSVIGVGVTQAYLQKALQASELRYKTLFDEAGDAIVICNSQGSILDVNQFICDQLGYKRDQLMDMQISDLPAPEFEDIGRQQFARLMEVGHVVFETGFVHQNGRTIPIELSAKTIEHDGETAVLGIARDITERKQAEEALLKNEDRLSKIMIAANDGMWDWDLTTHKVYFDPRYYEMAGYAVNEFPYQHEEFQKRVHPDDIQSVLEQTLKHLNGEIERYRAEFRFKKKDGSWLWIMGRGVVVERDEDGVPRRFVGTHTDITARIQAEAALKESEERFRHLVEMSPDGIVLHRDGQLIYANSAAADLLGTESPDDLVGQPIDAFVHPDNWPTTQRRGAALMAGGQDLYPAEDVYVRVDGTAVPVEVTAAPLTYQGETAVQVIFRDISDRKESEAAVQRRVSQVAILNDIGSRITAVLDLDSVLERAANLLHERFGYHHVALFLINHDQNEIVLHARAGQFTQLVPLAHRLKMGEGLIGWVAQHKKALLINDVSVDSRYLNFYVKDMLAQSELTVPIQVGTEIIGILDIQSQQRDAFDQNDVVAMETLAGQLAVAVENARLHTVAKDHVADLENRVQARTAELQQRVVEVERLNIGILNLLTDLKSANEHVTRTVHQLEEANAELESFAYSISHDLRAPLRHISGFISMLQKREGERLDEKSAHYLQVINEAAARMSLLIDELLVFSRTGRQDLFTRIVDVDKLVSEVRLDLVQDLEGRDVVWEIGPLPSVMADPTLLRQVWANLLENAVKYTIPRAKARIKIGASLSSQGNEITYFIQDNGVGFNEKYIDKLFGVFQRLHREDEFEGTGIGLAIVRRIVHRHNGRVWAEGKIDQGAAFYFTLPKGK